MAVCSPLTSSILLCSLCCIVLPSVQADPLGRLFFSAEQRTEMDKIHRARSMTRIEQQHNEWASSVETRPSKQVKKLHFQGKLSRNGRLVSVWINDQENEYQVKQDRDHYPKKPMLFPNSIETPYSLTIDHQGSSKKLKVGQVWSLIDGDVYESGQETRRDE